MLNQPSQAGSKTICSNLASVMYIRVRPARYDNLVVGVCRLSFDSTGNMQKSAKDQKSTRFVNHDSQERS